METEKDYILGIFNRARAQGLCKNQTEFASLLGMNTSTISRALQGNAKYLTSNMVKRVRTWADQVLTDEEPDQQKNDVIQDDEIMDRITRTNEQLAENNRQIAETNAQLVSMLQQFMQGAAFVSSPTAVGKKLQVDRD